MDIRSLKVCHATKRVPSPELVEKGRNHVARMSGNPVYPDPMPSLADVARACDELDLASQRFEFNRGRLDLVARDAAHHRLCLLIRALASYVHATCNGSRENVLSAGFETKRRPSPSQPMAAPGNVRAMRSELPGTIKLRWGGVKGKKLYAVYITNGDPGKPEGWSLLMQTTKNYCTVPDLVSDSHYTFRVSAYGALGEGPVSDVAMAKAA